MNTIRPWLELPNFEELLQDSNLDEYTKIAARFYADNGYLVIDPEIKDFESKS